MDSNGSSGTGGVAAGAATAVAGMAAPTALMALTTTFGVASTGTAISTLSGAALTNATLAAIGGGSMAAGSTLLGALGPIGLIAGIGIMSFTGFRANKKNKAAISEYETAIDKYREGKDVNNKAITNIYTLKRQIEDSLETLKENEHHQVSISKKLIELQKGAELLNTPISGD